MNCYLRLTTALALRTLNLAADSGYQDAPSSSRKGQARTGRQRTRLGRRSTAIHGSVDAKIYEDELSLWLPSKIIDCHVHISLAKHCGPISPERLKTNWALEVGVELSWEGLRDNYQTLFPGRDVAALAFGGVFRETDIEANNDYVLGGLAKNQAWGLFVTRPEWSPDRIADAMAKGFIGIKPYPDLAPQGTTEVSIFDFLPKSHLAVLNELGGVLMLHLPRAGRLADPENIKELLEIAEAYPAVRVIVAHVGRAFCLPTAKEGLPSFRRTANVYFDIAANLNAEVFQYALETIGPDRLLFGSDLPITLMRGTREHMGDKYINYTEAPYSWNTNRKSPEEEACYTWFLYEELRALVKAVERSGFGADVMEKIVYSNGAGLLGGD